MVVNASPTQFAPELEQSPVRTAHVEETRFELPRRIRPLRQEPHSLALERFSRGQEFVAPLGNRSNAYLAVKRLTDIVGALALLMVLGPIMLVALAVLTVTTKGNPLFFQERIGYCGRRFRMIKFRTMRLDA